MCVKYSKYITIVYIILNVKINELIKINLFYVSTLYSIYINQTVKNKLFI